MVDAGSSGAVAEHGDVGGVAAERSYGQPNELQRRHDVQQAVVGHRPNRLKVGVQETCATRTKCVKKALLVGLYCLSALLSQMFFNFLLRSGFSFPVRFFQIRNKTTNGYVLLEACKIAKCKPMVTTILNTEHTKMFLKAENGYVILGIKSTDCPYSLARACLKQVKPVKVMQMYWSSYI